MYCKGVRSTGTGGMERWRVWRGRDGGIEEMKGWKCRRDGGIE